MHHDDGTATAAVVHSGGSNGNSRSLNEAVTRALARTTRTLGPLRVGGAPAPAGIGAALLAELESPAAASTSAVAVSVDPVRAKLLVLELLNLVTRLEPAESAGAGSDSVRNSGAVPRLDLLARFMRRVERQGEIVYRDRLDAESRDLFDALRDRELVACDVGGDSGFASWDELRATAMRAAAYHERVDPLAAWMSGLE